ncbi:MAG: response regulator [Candidatus Levybacteria bacterium]|nr:response regulator [Candidatus Levybacteria bacterium]
MAKITNHKKKLLIIEDEPIFLELLTDKFESEEFKTFRAQTAEKGIKLALKHHPDLILLDIILPKMDGLAMLSILRKDRWGKNTPVIILSNTSDQKRVSQALKLGVYDYLVKTNFTLKELVSQVKEVVRY